MASIEFVTIEVADTAAAKSFYAAAFDVGDRIRLRESAAPTTGFRGCTLSLVVATQAAAKAIIDAALDAGATSLKPAAKSLWGYGGVVRAPDGTVWTVASSPKSDGDLVLQLGVADVAATKSFYVDRGLRVAKSYGRRYVEFDTAPVTLTLYKRRALAKVAGVPAEGTGSHRLTIGGDTSPFTDPDGFEWTVRD